MNNFHRVIVLISVLFLIGISFSAQSQNNAQRRQTNSRNGATIEMKTVVADFNSYLETVPFYASSTLEKEILAVDEHIKNLNNWKDKGAYIAEHRLNSFINATRDSLKLHTEDVSKLASDFLNSKYRNRTIENRAACEDSLKSIVRERLQQREELLNKLEKEINSTPENTGLGLDDIDWKLITIGLAIFVVLCAILWLVTRSKGKSNGKNYGKGRPQYVSKPSSAANGSTLPVL